MREIVAFSLLLIIAMSGCATASDTADGGENMKVTSPAFENEGDIPGKYTCKGEDISPPLKIEDVPDEAKTLALIVDDPDAPAGTWVHWVVWNISPGGNIAENTVPPGAKQGTNDFRKKDYGGPCPPSGTHRYFVRVYALSGKPDLEEGATRDELDRAMEGKIIEQATLMGRFSK